MDIHSPLYGPALDILSALERHGHTCWLVGGCVRDWLISVSAAEKQPRAALADIDLATSATPDQMMEVFIARGWPALPTGIKHGTLTVRVRNSPVEVTTYRTDGEYSDGRHPDQVTFTGDVNQDLSRRDFTINAMAWHPERGLLDPHGGRKDLALRFIRAVGDPERRFEEDALRMLRAVRFAAKLGFTIEENTWEAMCAQAPSISRVAHERCAVELMGVVCSSKPETLRILRDAGLLWHLLPEIDTLFDPETGAQRNPHHVHTVGEHTLCVMQNVPPDPVLRLAALLHDAGKPLCRGVHPEDGRDTFYGHPEESERIAQAVLRRLGAPKRQVDRILPLIRYHDSVPAPDAYSLKRLLCRVSDGGDAKVGAAFFDDWMTLKCADILGQNPDTHGGKLAELDKLKTLYGTVVGENQPYALSQLAINGDDITAMGIQGPQVGHILDACLRMVTRSPAENKRKKLLREAARHVPKERRSFFPLIRK